MQEVGGQEDEQVAEVEGVRGAGSLSWLLLLSRPLAVAGCPRQPLTVSCPT